MFECYTIKKNSKKQEKFQDSLLQRSGAGSGHSAAAASSSPLPGAAAPPSVAAIPAAGTAAAPAQAGSATPAVPTSVTTAAAVAHFHLHPATKEDKTCDYWVIRTLITGLRM
jgi:hypothetical protein